MARNRVPRALAAKCRELAGLSGPAAETEAEFQAQVMALARLHGWRVYHTHDSRNSPDGFPDLVLVHRARGLLAAELKVGRNEPTAAQRAWLEDLEAVGVPAHVWRPADWAVIERTLSGGQADG